VTVVYICTNPAVQSGDLDAAYRAAALVLKRYGYECEADPKWTHGKYHRYARVFNHLAVEHRELDELVQVAMSEAAVAYYHVLRLTA